MANDQAPYPYPMPPPVVVAPTPLPVRNNGLIGAIIGVIITVMLQSAGIVWWASGIEHRVASLEADHPNYQSQSVALGKIEQSLNDLIARFDRLENRAALSRAAP